MADSDSDQFESADEDFSGTSDTECCQPVSSSDTIKANTSTIEGLPSTLQQLNLQDSNQRSENLIDIEPTSCSSKKILETTSIEKKEISCRINKPKQSSCSEAIENTDLSTESSKDVKNPSCTSSESLNKSEDAIQRRTESDAELSLSCSKADSSSNSQSKKLVEISKTPAECTVKSQQNVQQTSSPTIPSSLETNQSFETGSKTSLERNEEETAWNDNWAEDTAFATSLNVQPSEDPSATTKTPGNNSEEDDNEDNLQNDSQKVKDSLEKSLKSQLPQSVLKNIDTGIDLKSCTTNKTENTNEGSWNDGWEDDFEIEDDGADAESQLKKEGISDSGVIEDDKDGWDDDWDTDEIAPSSKESSNKGIQVPNSSNSLSETGSKVPKGIDDKITQQSNAPRPVTKIAPKQEQKVFQQQQQQQQDGWFGWGMTNILSSATEGLSSITSNVTSAFESTIGAPDPEDVLRAQKEQGPAEASRKESAAEATKPEDGSGLSSNLFSVSSWTKFVESTGNKVLSTGLDTLETIGKKTMEVLQEGDPGLKKKRAKLREFVSEPGKPVLSQVLREAKEKAETSSRKNEAALIESRANFEILFDDFEGLVHLEALEMISKQCQIKLDSLALTFSGSEAKNFKETLQEVEELCELPEDDENLSKQAMADKDKFKLAVSEVLTKLDVDIPYSKLSEASELVENRLTKDYTDPLELHRIAISSLVEICAAAMLIFHRAAEMLVIKQKHSTIAETDSLMSFGALVCSKLQGTADQFSSKLSIIDPTDNTKVSHVAKEAVNSITYTQTACQLLVPILQYGAVV